MNSFEVLKTPRMQEQLNTGLRPQAASTLQSETTDFIPKPTPFVMPSPRPRNGQIRAAPPTAGLDGFAINVAPQTPEEKAKTYIDDSLNRFRFKVDSDEQRALEVIYKGNAIPALVVRMAAYKSDTCAPGQSMGTSLSKASLPILMSATQGFISSALRTPVSNVVSLAMDPTKAEFSTHCSRMSTAGTVSGFTAYLTSEIVINAMDRRAKAGNVPKIESVEVAGLIPVPCKVVLKIVDGEKTYVELTKTEHDKLIDKHATARKKALDFQNELSGKGFLSSLIQPILTATTNTMRRSLGTPASLVISSQLYFSSALASGLAGGITKAGLSLAQVTPWLSQIEVDDFVGGKKKINLFEVRNPDPDVTKNPAQLWDLGTGVRQTGAEIIALSSHTMNLKRPRSEILNQVQDVARYIGFNVFSHLGAAGLGILASSDFRGDGLVSNSSEAYNSPAKLIRQFLQSGANEMAWKATQESTKSGAYSVGKSLDIKRRRLL
jgi:hypothetical protein